MRKVVMVVLVLLSVVGAGAWFLTDSRQSAAWKADELNWTKGVFYGASRFLESYGHGDVRRRRVIDGLNGLDGRGNLLAFSRMEQQDAERAAGELLDWVGRGNHLILPVGYVPHGSDLHGIVLSRVGVAAQKVPPLPENGEGQDGGEKIQAYEPNLSDCLAVHRRYREAGAALDKEVQPPSGKEYGIVRCTHELNRLSWPQDGREWLLRSRYPQVSFVPQEGADVYFAGRSPLGSQFVRVGFGAGSITLVEDVDWLGNPIPPLFGDDTSSDIKTYHHADLLAHLAAGTETVWLVETLKWQPQGLPAPTWWKIFRSQPVAAVLILAALSVFIWHQAARVGLVRILPPAPERYLNRHFLAQGQFLLRHLDKTAVLRRLQRDLLEDLHRRHPAWGRLTVGQQLDWLCGQTRLPQSLIRPWLAPLPDKLSGVRWIELLQGHRRIVQALKRGSHD